MNTDTDQGDIRYTQTEASGTVKQGRRPMYKSFKAERDEYKTHADTLAEALREIAEREWQGEEKTWRAEAIEMQDEARAALAAYEEAK